MKITIESTSKIVELVYDGKGVPARVWQGETENGIPVQCFITRIAPEIRKDHPEIDTLTAVFERDLKSQADPRPTVEAIPLRMILSCSSNPVIAPAPCRSCRTARHARALLHRSCAHPA